MDDKIRKIMSEVFSVPVESISEESSRQNLESWNSLNHLQMVFALEDEFQITLSPSEATRIIDFQSVKELLNNKITWHNDCIVRLIVRIKEIDAEVGS